MNDSAYEWDELTPKLSPAPRGIPGKNPKNPPASLPTPESHPPPVSQALPLSSDGDTLRDGRTPGRPCLRAWPAQYAGLPRYGTALRNFF